MQTLFALRRGWLVVGFALATLSTAMRAAEPASPPVAGPPPFTHAPELFPVLPWDVLHGWNAPHRNPRHGLESIAECNFTLAGFVTQDRAPFSSGSCYRECSSRASAGLEESAPTTPDASERMVRVRSFSATTIVEWYGHQPDTAFGPGGPVTADTARQLGFDVAIVAEEYTIPGLCTAIVDHYRSRRGTPP